MLVTYTGRSFLLRPKYRKNFSCVVKLKALKMMGQSYAKAKLRPVAALVI
jgi:hypothetical protein